MLAKREPRTPRERTGMVLCERDAAGRLLPIDALARFAAKCQFDPATGCVLWTGGTTRGRGNSAVYGSFWDAGRRWFAHRWSGVHIHGLDLDGTTAGHCCPGGGRTLCVEHVEAQTLAANIAERNTRVAANARQTASERQYWLLVERGYEPGPEPPPALDPGAIPFHAPPLWLRPFLPELEIAQCPF